MYYTSLEYFEKKYDSCEKKYAFRAKTQATHVSGEIVPDM